LSGFGAEFRRDYPPMPRLKCSAGRSREGLTFFGRACAGSRSRPLRVS
jgi:hypothetical protein